MNRTIIVVKAKQNQYRLIRLHWNFGQPVADWLVADYPTHTLALNLIDAGHRSTIETPHRFILPEHQVFRTLTGARSWCEHTTFAYHNGKRWRIELDATP